MPFLSFTSCAEMEVTEQMAQLRIHVEGEGDLGLVQGGGVRTK